MAKTFFIHENNTYIIIYALSLFFVVSMAVNAVTIDTYEDRLDKTNKTAQIKNILALPLTWIFPIVTRMKVIHSV